MFEGSCQRTNLHAIIVRLRGRVGRSPIRGTATCAEQPTCSRNQARVRRPGNWRAQEPCRYGQLTRHRRLTWLYIGLFSPSAFCRSSADASALPSGRPSTPSVTVLPASGFRAAASGRERLRCGPEPPHLQTSHSHAACLTLLPPPREAQRVGEGPHTAAVVHAASSAVSPRAPRCGRAPTRPGGVSPP